MLFRHPTKRLQDSYSSHLYSQQGDQLQSQQCTKTQNTKLTNKAEQTKNRAEDFNDKNLDKELRVGGIGERGGRAGDADRDTTEEVAETDGEAAPEEREAWC